MANLIPNVYFINIYDPIKADPLHYFEKDQTHINAAGYDLLTEQLLPILDQIKATEEPS